MKPELVLGTIYKNFLLFLAIFRRSPAGARLIPAFLGHITGFAIALLTSPFALIYHTVLGATEVSTWGWENIAELSKNKKNQANPSQEDESNPKGLFSNVRQRYVIQHALAIPGYLIGFALSAIILLGRLLVEGLLYNGLYKNIIKPFGEAFKDAIVLFSKALFLDRIPIRDHSNENTKQSKPLIGNNSDEKKSQFEALSSFKKQLTGWSTLPSFIGRLLAFTLALGLLPLAWGWHTLNTCVDSIAWGARYMWSEKDTKSFKEAMEKRYAGQDALGILGYALAALVCLLISPICLVNRYKSEIEEGIKTGFKGLVAFLALVIVGEIKSLTYLVANLFVFVGELFSLNPRGAGLALEKAFVHLLGFISLGILDALYRSTFGRPELVGMSQQDPNNSDPEDQAAVKLRIIYNTLDNGGALPHENGKIDWSTLDSAIKKLKEKPSFSHLFGRRIAKSTDLGLDSPTEAALKEITTAFKKEKGKGKCTFFAQKEDITIIDAKIDNLNINNKHHDRDKLELEELKETLNKHLH